MSTDIAPFFEATLTPDGHRALLSIASINGVPPSVVLGQILAAVEPHLLDAAALKSGIVAARADFDVAFACQLEVIDLFGAEADLRPFLDALADALVRVEKLRMVPRVGPLVNARCQLL